MPPPACEVGGGLVLAGRPLGDAQRGDHDQEHGDGADVDRLLLDAFDGARARKAAKDAASRLPAINAVMERFICGPPSGLLR